MSEHDAGRAEFLGRVFRQARKGKTWFALDIDAAAGVIERGWSRFPGELRLDMEWAQLAVAQQDWPEAVDRLASRP